MPANKPYPQESKHEFKERAAKKGAARAKANKKAKAGGNPFKKAFGK